MTDEFKKYENDVVVDAKPVDEQEVMVSAEPANNGPPIPAGHARFYCSKCRTVSRDLYNMHWGEV